ncbi:MAG: PEP-CTERM sorting domain-containing protein [Phycisphaerae bacterium]|nr:PEP-CTERM sorting domain-containing protein [Phycisphaerae bacterium]
MMRRSLMGLSFVVVLVGLSWPAMGQFWSIYHDPWLNWDFWNFSGQVANDLDIVVENANYNPGLNWWSNPFNTLTVTNNIDVDNDGDGDTILRYSGAVINPPVNPLNPQPNEVAHGGVYTKGSDGIVTAYWTKDGAKIGNALAISYELTEIRPSDSGEIHMQLIIAPGFYADDPSEQAGWTEIRTFRNIPASLLGLGNLNRDLNLSTLSAYEVTPYRGQPGIPGSTGVPILPGVQILRGEPDSFFDVYLDTVEEEYLNPNYEALLVATVLNQGTPVGMFWNLNPQSPEPGTLALLSVGGLALIRRRRK